MLNKKAFTLLEIIIVIIIVGVLVSIAFPRFFTIIEKSRSSEAYGQISALRTALQMCYTQKGKYADCAVGTAFLGTGWDHLMIENPSDIPGSHFDYDFVVTGQPPIIPIFSGSSTFYNYIIFARRNTVDGGDGTSSINFIETPSSGSRYIGTGVYESLTTDF